MKRSKQGGYAYWLLSAVFCLIVQFFGAPVAVAQVVPCDDETEYLSPKTTGAIVVSHDSNPLGSSYARIQEATFAVNVAKFITKGRTTKKLLWFESNPNDGRKDLAPIVLEALTKAGFTVTVTLDYSTPFSDFDAIFVAEKDWGIFLDNNVLINYVNGGGGVYLSRGENESASAEAAGWNTFLNYYGLAFVAQYNQIYSNVAITSAHPIFAGVTDLRSGNGQSILNLGTNPNAAIVQYAGDQGTYAVVNGGAVPATLYGPSEYLCYDGVKCSGKGSPFVGKKYSYFYLEDFEDHLLNTPGITANHGGPTSIEFGPGVHDSVDADDGVIDGSGLNGDSFFHWVGAEGIRFSFDPA